jgi:hypothetical protein
LGTLQVSRNEVVDAIDKCIGMAETIQRHLFWKQTANPFYYLIIVVPFLVRIPFLILQRAGLPEQVEQTLWGHIVKAALLLILALVFVHYGLKFKVSDLVGFLK